MATWTQREESLGWTERATGTCTQHHGQSSCGDPAQLSLGALWAVFRGVGWGEGEGGREDIHAYIELTYFTVWQKLTNTALYNSYPSIKIC